MLLPPSGHRFIPACAGNRGGTTATAGWLTVHPRVRGEQNRAKGAGLRVFGSSPRARGTGQQVDYGIDRARFIPACAGNRVKQTAGVSVAPVHPRVRGEQLHAAGPEWDLNGSSPRARGTVDRTTRRAVVQRFIPACAGNRRGSSFARVSSQVHPRVRGEQSPPAGGAGQKPGSSPRARGTAYSHDAACWKLRFIPACAGNSFLSLILSSIYTVHPRVRGEQWYTALTITCRTGSSPRARGTAYGVESGHPQKRFIPACAGNSVTLPSHSQPSTVHPRVRGEQPRMEKNHLVTYGSSPRARGTDALGDSGLAVKRFIPACAGNRGKAHQFTDRSPVHPRVRGEQ